MMLGMKISVNRGGGESDGVIAKLVLVVRRGMVAVQRRTAKIAKNLAELGWPVHRPKHETCTYLGM